jgi:hypothetical protein
VFKTSLFHLNKQAASNKYIKKLQAELHKSVLCVTADCSAQQFQLIIHAGPILINEPFQSSHSHDISIYRGLNSGSSRVCDIICLVCLPHPSGCFVKESYQ